MSLQLMRQNQQELTSSWIFPRLHSGRRGWQNPLGHPNIFMLHIVTPSLMKTTTVDWNCSLEFANLLVAKLHDCTVTWLQSWMVAKLNGCKINWLQTYMVENLHAWLKICRVKKLESCGVAKLQGCKLAELQTCILRWSLRIFYFWQLKRNQLG